MEVDQIFAGLRATSEQAGERIKNAWTEEDRDVCEALARALHSILQAYEFLNNSKFSQGPEIRFIEGYLRRLHCVRHSSNSEYFLSCPASDVVYITKGLHQLLRWGATHTGPFNDRCLTLWEAAPIFGEAYRQCLEKPPEPNPAPRGEPGWTPTLIKGDLLNTGH